MSDHSVVSSSIPSRKAARKRGLLKTLARPLVHGLKNWQRHKASVTLEGLSDHMLRDIGISRNDIPSVVDGLLREGEMRPRTTGRLQASDQIPSTP